MKLFWKIYSFLFLAIVLNDAIQILDKGSHLGVYYNTTIVFSNWFFIPYFLNLLSVLINGIACLFLFGYAYEIKKLSIAPQWLFYLRILCDCVGHTYGWQMIRSGFSQSKLAGFAGLASMILPILPSYLAQWRQTFFIASN